MSTRVAAVLAAAIALTAPSRAVARDGGVRVVVDQRTELMSIVFRLAGAREYGNCRIPSYEADIERHFAPYRNHAVVARARQLREARGVSYDAPMTLAVHVTQPPDLRERVPLEPWPPRLDRRWTAGDVRAFLADLRAFARESRFAEFVRAHEAVYRTWTQRMERTVRDSRVVEWLAGFFGTRQGAEYVVALGPLNGGGNYGVSLEVGGREEIYSVMGIWQLDAAGVPVFGAGVYDTLAHEMCHTYANPLIDASLGKLGKPGQAIFAKLQNEMSSQAYGSWQIVMRESLVRACTVRYVRATLGAPAASKEEEAQRGRHFLWVAGLADLLGEYEKDRQRYPTLDTFMPRVVAFFEEYVTGGRFAADLARVQEERAARLAAIEAKSPKIVSMSPANGSTGVPAATATITIVFDRPMERGNMALMLIPGAEFPPNAPGSRPRFDAEGKVLTLACRLQPGKTYGFGLNSLDNLTMRDTSGNRLAPTSYRFTTSAR